MFSRAKINTQLINNFLLNTERVFSVRCLSIFGVLVECGARKIIKMDTSDDIMMLNACEICVCNNRFFTELIERLLLFLFFINLNVYFICLYYYYIASIFIWTLLFIYSYNLYWNQIFRFIADSTKNIKWIEVKWSISKR